MYGFPTQLYPVPQGMFEDQSAGFGTGIQREIFYSIKNGNWSDISVWETVSGRVGRLPTAIDNVYVRNRTTVTVNITASIDNLFISGTLKAAAGGPVLSILGNLKSVGLIDFTGSSVNLTLYGTDNSISNFISGGSTITYARNGDQFIIPVQYYNLTIPNVTGIKYLISDLYAYRVNLGSYATVATMELGNYSAYIGAGGFSCQSILSKIGEGILQIDGRFAFIASTTMIKLTGNPDVRLGGGINVWGANGGMKVQETGTGQWTFLTNNQAIDNGSGVFYGLTFKCSILIQSITLTNDCTSTNPSYPDNSINLYNTLNGVDNLSKFVNTTYVYYRSPVQPMIVGVLDCSTSPNHWFYDLGGDQEINGTTYRSLQFGGSGVKKLMGNVVVDVTNGGSWSITGTATIDYNGYTITTI